MIRVGRCRDPKSAARATPRRQPVGLGTGLSGLAGRGWVLFLRGGQGIGQGPTSPRIGVERTIGRGRLLRRAWQQRPHPAEAGRRVRSKRINEASNSASRSGEYSRRAIRSPRHVQLRHRVPIGPERG